jgi:hypothetical protein
MQQIAKVGYINRIKDVSGVSGTGRVAEFIEYDDKVIIRWISGNIRSLTIYHNIEEVKNIMCHNGNSEIIYY